MTSTPVEQSPTKPVDTKIEPGAQVPRPAEGGLMNGELFWRNHYQWLESIGYRLRRRYEPNWVPSWYSTKKYWFKSEDGQPLNYYGLADAVRVNDGADVALKIVSLSSYPYEVDIATYLSSDPLASDPRNHSVPIYAVIQVPDDDDLTLLVMPTLRQYDNPRFDTLGETIEFFKQMFEGLQFMHHHHIAHRDCSGNNMMMDGQPLYPDGFHPVVTSRKRDYTGRAKHFTRTQRAPKYYLIDFGLSRRYPPDDHSPVAAPIMGGDKTVPEFQNYNGGSFDPFPTDVYYIGNMVREDFIMAKSGFEFMEPLIADMIQAEPSKRPSMDEVVGRFEGIRAKLSTWRLRSRVRYRRENSLVGFYRGIGYWIRRISFMVNGVPPVPSD